jgi:hypothetical protein
MKQFWSKIKFSTPNKTFNSATSLPLTNFGAKKMQTLNTYWTLDASSTL